jgi:lactate dehydrogenase-like 2-hydroxyacid dehydrogenase
MKIIVVNKSTDFTEDQINKLKEKGEVVFIENKEDWIGYKDVDSDEEKILLLDPGIAEWKFSNDRVKDFNNLKAICLPTTDFSWVDVNFLKEKGVLVTNVPKYSTEAVAEHCILLMLSLAKKLPLIIRSDWNLDESLHLGNNVKGKVMGIIGLGDIGTRTAELGDAIGMDVKYWSRSSRDKRFEYLEIEDLIKSSDYIFLTMAENKDTEDFFNRNKVDMMKKTSSIVNIAGEGIWDLEYLYEKLQRNEISGIGFESDSKKIAEYKGNVMVTPHIAWYTKESFDEDFRIWADCVISIIDKEPINVVN